MNYILESLGPNEKIIHVGRFHWFYDVSAYLWIIMGIVAMFVVLGVSVYFNIETSIPNQYKVPQFHDKAWEAFKDKKGGYFQIALNLPIGLKMLAFAMFIAGLYSFSKMMVIKASTEIAVTNKRLVYKVGVVSRSVGEIDIFRIEGVNVLQGVLGRIFGYGRIAVRGTGVGAVTLPPIANPITFRKAIDFARYKDKRQNID